MRRFALLQILFWVAGFGLLGATAAEKPPAKPTSTSKKSAQPSSKQAATAKKGTSATNRSASRTTSSRGKKRIARKRAPGWRSGQQAPTPERYREIQQALIDRGYLQGTATGEWGPDSAEALRRFQQDQNIGPTGKLDSLSLIALGLGPNRNPASRNGRATPAEPREQP